MIRLLVMGLAASMLLVSEAHSDETLSPAEKRVHGCLAAAASSYRLPQSLILILLRVEGGQLGAVSFNTNNSVDIGPMQVNTIWVPQIARHWHATPQAAYAALRDNFCANIEGGTWILRQALDEAGGDFWSGVGIYHSHNPVHKDAYLRKVLEWTLRLRDQARQNAAATRAVPVPDAPRQVASRN